MYDQRNNAVFARSNGDAGWVVMELVQKKADCWKSNNAFGQDLVNVDDRPLSQIWSRSLLPLRNWGSGRLSGRNLSVLQCKPVAVKRLFRRLLAGSQGPC